MRNSTSAKPLLLSLRFLTISSGNAFSAKPGRNHGFCLFIQKSQLSSTSCARCNSHKASSWILKCWIQTHPADRHGPLVISHDTSSSVSLPMIIILKLFVLNMVFCLTQVITLSFTSVISKAAVVCVVASGS